MLSDPNQSGEHDGYVVFVENHNGGGGRFGGGMENHENGAGDFFDSGNV